MDRDPIQVIGMAVMFLGSLGQVGVGLYQHKMLSLVFVLAVFVTTCFFLYFVKIALEASKR